jgi:hypothetical protein
MKTSKLLSRKSFTSFIFISIFLLLLQTSFAITVPSSQQSIEIAVIVGKEFSYLLIFQNEEDVTKEINITCSGDCSVVRFGGERKESYRLFIAPHSQVFLPVYIQTQKIGEYDAVILADSTIISRLKIYSTVSPETAKEFLKQKNISEELRETVSTYTNKAVEQILKELSKVNLTLISEAEKLSKKVEKITEVQKIYTREDFLPTEKVLTEGEKTEDRRISTLIILLAGIGALILYKKRRKIIAEIEWIIKTRARRKYSYKPKSK